MVDQIYRFSRWIYSVMEGFLDWTWNLIRSGRLDYILENWLIVALMLSVSAFVIDMLFYYLREGKETLAVKAVLFIFSGVRRLYLKIRGIDYASDDGNYLEESDEETTREDGDKAFTQPDFALATEPSTYEYERATGMRVDGRKERTITREDPPVLQPDNNEEAPEPYEYEFDGYLEYQKQLQQGGTSYVIPEIAMDDREVPTTDHHSAERQDERIMNIYIDNEEKSSGRKPETYDDDDA